MEDLFCPNNIVWGDVATWVSGLGALAAVIVALYLAGESDRRRAKDRAHARRVFAIYIAQELGDVRVSLPRIRRRLKAVEDLQDRELAALNWPSTVQMIRSLNLPLLQQSADKITLFDGDTARFVASTVAGLAQLKGALAPWGAAVEEVAMDSHKMLQPLRGLVANLQRYANGAHQLIWQAAAFNDRYPIDPDTELDSFEQALIAAYDRSGGSKPID
ncbi:hypothetical protein [Dokdonella sp.]|uniref:hypothetical protein n=1 Tax=Dokdonella sp. TaxID=2291710 RepID=UPI00378307BA